MEIIKEETKKPLNNYLPYQLTSAKRLEFHVVARKILAINGRSVTVLSGLGGHPITGEFWDSKEAERFKTGDWVDCNIFLNRTSYMIKIIGSTPQEFIPKNPHAEIGF